MVRASVVVPAHNEAAVIGRCLDALLRDAGPGELEIVVACNGCTDGTAELVRVDHGEDVRVLELGEASKIAALNAGDEACTAFPRFYVDADVEIETGALRAVADLLAAGTVEAAAPRPAFELSDRPWALRAFYATWQRLPYLNDDMVGTGVYALSERGRARFGQFPELTADDQFIMQLFSPPLRRSVNGTTFLVHTPMTLRGLVKMRTRAYRGNLELEGSGQAATAATGGAGKAMLTLAGDPRAWVPLGVYVGINLLAKVRARRLSSGWERDNSARAVAGS